MGQQQLAIFGHTSGTLAATILVVDDERAVRELLARWLGLWGYTVHVAADARAGLEAMLASPADVLITDLKLTDRDGFWLIERVRSKWPRTPVVVASSSVELGVVDKARKFGAVDYVMKPFHTEMLRQALTRAGYPPAS